MKTKFPHKSNFLMITLAGSVLIILVIILGIGFFNAIYNTQIESRKDFLTQQTALAARGLETEVERFKTESNALLAYLTDPKRDQEDFGDELTVYSRRLFNTFPKMIDQLWVDLGDSVLVFSQTERNDFLRNKTENEFPKPGDEIDYIGLQHDQFRILLFLNLPGFSKDYVANYYLNPGGGKFLFLNNRLFSVSAPGFSEEFQIQEEYLDEVSKEVNMGLKGLHEISWSDQYDHEVDGILVQYPFNYSPSRDPAALVFVVPKESLTSGIYSTFLFIFIVIVLVLSSTVLFFVIFLRNIQESDKIREENLKEISTLFEQQNLLMSELKGFVFYHDHKGEIIRVSDEVEGIIGHPKSEFIQAFNLQTLHSKANQLRELVKDSLASDKDLIDFEYDFQKPNGDNIRLRIFCKLIFSEDKKLEGGLGLCTDITKQYKVKEKIIQSEGRLRSLIQNIPDTIFIYDNQGTVLDFHVQEKEHLHEAAVSTLGKNLEQFVPHGQKNEVIQVFHKSRKTGQIQAINVFWVTPSGAESHFEMRFFPLDENQMMSISKDITSQKIWEKGLMEAMNAADKASRAKSEFLANMSHEIRTPMNGLLGIIDLLEETKLDRIQKQYVEIIKNSGNSLLNIIRDILDYSKIEAGEFGIESLVFDPIKELNAQVEILSGMAKKKNIDLTVSHNLQDAAILEGDRNKINQILLNLIGNAIKFTPEKGKVEIRMDLDDLENPLAFLSFMVKDSGIGISKENILNLTKPFYQVDSSISRNFQGTGLGLAIAKKVIELLGGELMIESELGRGSEFSFTVLVKKSDQKLENIEHQALSWKDVREMGAVFPLKILLAEDNELNLQLMSLMFGQLGFQFEIARNGIEALEKVRAHKFDVVLMDVQMPLMNGLETTKEIRKLPNKEDLIIIGLSANVFEEDQKKALRAGMTDYLTKPIRLAVLADKLEFYFRKTREKNI